MKPILNREQEETILISNITDQHIVVARLKGIPCILGKENGEYVFYKFKYEYNPTEKIITEAGGIGFKEQGGTIQSVIQKVISYSYDGQYEIAVFNQVNWKEALQWLIDNAD